MTFSVVCLSKRLQNTLSCHLLKLRSQECCSASIKKFQNVEGNFKCYTTTNTPKFWKQTSILEGNGLKDLSRRPCHSINQKKISIKEGDRVTEIRCITQDDVDIFSKVTGDHNPIHTKLRGDSEGPGIVHGALLNGLVSGVIGSKLPGPGTMVVSETLHFPNSCFAGEEITVVVEISSVRKVIACRFSCTVTRESEITVMHGEAKLVSVKEFPSQT